MNNQTFLSLLRIALRHIYVLIVSALVCAIIAFSYCSFLATPKYSATGSVLVTNGAIIGDSTSSGSTGSSTVNGTDITASLQLANTVTDILKTSDIYKDLAGKVGDGYTYEKLIGASTIKRRNTDTLFIDITFTAPTKAEAIKLVNTYLNLAPDYILNFVPNSTAEVVTTADTAQKTFPRTIFITAAAALVGALVSFVILYIVAFFNNTIKSEDDILDNYEITIIGNIPDFSNAQTTGYYNSYGYGQKTYSKEGGNKYGK